MCHGSSGEPELPFRKEVRKVSYIKPTYYEEAVDVNATTPGLVAVVAIIVIVAEVVANVANTKA
jgi:hypothetical protein